MRWTVRRAAPSGSGGANAPILGMHGSLSILPWHAFSFAVPVQAGTVETSFLQLLPPQPAPPKLLCSVLAPALQRPKHISRGASFRYAVASHLKSRETPRRSGQASTRHSSQACPRSRPTRATASPRGEVVGQRRVRAEAVMSSAEAAPRSLAPGHIGSFHHRASGNRERARGLQPPKRRPPREC